MENFIDDPEFKNFVDSIDCLNHKMEYFISFYILAGGFVSFGNIAFHLTVLKGFYELLLFLGLLMLSCVCRLVVPITYIIFD